jgi:hypothetical protein
MVCIMLDIQPCTAVLMTYNELKDCGNAARNLKAYCPKHRAKVRALRFRVSYR